MSKVTQDNLTARIHAIFKDYGWQFFISQTLWLYDETSFLTIKNHFLGTKKNVIEIYFIAIDDEDERNKGKGTKLMNTFKSLMIKMMRSLRGAPTEVKLVAVAPPGLQEFYENLNFEPMMQKV